MKDPTRGPIFACLYPGLCDVARSHGYALAIHGTVVNDLDLVAIPWVDEVSDPVTLMTAIYDHIGACGYRGLLERTGHLTDAHVDDLVSREKLVGPAEAEIKPHGRLAWNLYLDAGVKIDLSIMSNQKYEKTPA